MTGTLLHYRARSWWLARPLPLSALAVLPLELLRLPLPRALPEDNESVKTIRAIEAQIRTLKGTP
jgi:hypothetical protein